MSDGIIDFDSELADVSAAPPIPFKFRGEIFTCSGVAPAMILIEFTSAAVQNNGLAAATHLLEFLQAVMPAEEYARFRTICNDSKQIVPVEHIAAIVHRLIQEYGGAERPTVPSSASPVTQQANGAGSQGGLPPVAFTSVV